MASSASVHIIDDDDAVRESLAVLLETHGLTIFAYRSAQAFLNESHLGPGDCVVTDVLMPGMDGLSLLRELGGRADTPPVIILAGRLDDALRRTAEDLGAFAVIAKPFTAERIVESVTAAMTTPRA